MSKGFYQMPYPENEVVRNYEPNSKELENLLNKYEEMYDLNINNCNLCTYQLYDAHPYPPTYVSQR